MLTRPPLIVVLPPHLSGLITAYAERKGWAPEDAAIFALLVRFAPETTAAEFADEGHNGIKANG